MNATRDRRSRSPPASIPADALCVDRWRRAGWIGYQQFLVGEPPWLWLTRTGLAAYDLTGYKAALPAISRLHHIHAVNSVRFDLESERRTWISERAIRAGRYLVLQGERDTRHIPDGILCTPSGDICIEVELTQKKPAELFHKMEAVLFASHPQTYGYAYTGIWYYTPDPRIKKALEAAREAHSRDRHMGRRAEIVKIILLEM